ncbi:MAG: AraC family transcriptional regulator [Clostridiaceae bacterium]|nr:AraC family transcriptional regulator [Clostridiaceae bacterium]
MISAHDLTDYRLGKACELLTSTAVRIADIPQMVGLASNPHFFYLFKRATNLTPSEYRLHKGLSQLVKL